MSNDRQFERQPAGYHAEVRRLDTGAIVGHLGDISIGGAMITAESPLAVGTYLVLAIELPRTSRVGETVNVAAVVRWCEADLEPGLYSIGLVFADQGPAAAEAHQILQRLLS